MKTLIIYKSIHHESSKKIAERMAKVLGADIMEPEQLNLEDVKKYDLLGFGSGIYDAKHHISLINLADKLPLTSKTKAFLFSTCGVTWEFPKNHDALKEKLKSKGYSVVDDFTCVGHNTNSFLKYFGGMNKGRPNEKDMQKVEEFARELIHFED